MMFKQICLVFCFLFCTVQVEQILATSSAGSVPDDSINRNRNRNRNRQEVAKAVLGESSANSLSPSSKKARKPRKLTKSVSSKQQPHQPLKEVKQEPISTELSLSTSPRAWGPRNAIKKDRVEHARARLMTGEYPQHGSKEHPIEISGGQEDRKKKMEQIRKHTSGELIRQIHAADQRKKQMKIEKKSDENIAAEPKKGSSSSNDGAKSNNGLDLNLHLRRRAISSDESNGSSTKLRLGQSSRSNDPTSHSMTTRSRTQPSYTPQHATQPSRQQNIAINEANRAPIGGPVRHHSGSVRSTAVHPYGGQHFPLTHQGQVQGHTNLHTQALIAQYRSAHIRSLQLTRPVHVIHRVPRSPIIRLVPTQPIHHQQETPISPGSQNLIDRVGHSQGRQGQSHPPPSDHNDSFVNLNLSLGS